MIFKEGITGWGVKFFLCNFALGCNIYQQFCILTYCIFSVYPQTNPAQPLQGKLFHNQLAIFERLTSDKLTSSLFFICCLIRLIFFTCKCQQGKEGTLTLMENLCNITLTLAIYFRLNNRHCVFLYNIWKRPFNMPYAFSHMT